MNRPDLAKMNILTGKIIRKNKSIKSNEDPKAHSQNHKNDCRIEHELDWSIVEFHHEFYRYLNSTFYYVRDKKQLEFLNLYCFKPHSFLNFWEDG